MAITSAIAATVGTAHAIYSGEKARKAQKSATAQARKDADAAARDADRAYNKSNPKQPNVAALLKSTLDAGQQGVAGTFLTGAGGAPVAPGMLGRSTLLGR